MRDWPRIPALVLATFALAACADSSTTEPGGPPLLRTTTVPTANGPVYVNGTFTHDIVITVPGGTGPGVNTHPQGKGGCYLDLGPQSQPTKGATDADNTAWYNEADNWTNAPFCRGDGDTEETVTITCTLDPIPATYAIGGGTPASPGPQTTSNENLNFLSDLEPQQPDLFVHFQANQAKTTGKGSLTVSYSCVPDLDLDGFLGTGTIDLTQFNVAGNRFSYVSSTSRKLAGVSLQSDDFGPISLDLIWDYRSRNLIPPTTP